MPPTYRDLYASFASHKVRYLLIGGAAAVAHGVQRATFDVDILIEATPENAAATLAAMLEIGMGTADLTDAQDLLAQEVTIFDDVLNVDVQTRTPGVVFAEAWERRQVADSHGVAVNVLALDDLIASKEAAGRPVDLDDVAALRRAQADQ